MAASAALLLVNLLFNLPWKRKKTAGSYVAKHIFERGKMRGKGTRREDIERDKNK